MEKNMLEKAKKYQKQKEWTKAVECYEVYLNESNKEISDKIYANYAKALKFTGYTRKAKQILLERLKGNQDSEHLLLELYRLYDSLNKWKEANIVAKQLVEINPKQANYYFFLGRTYAYLNSYEDGKQAYSIGLEYQHNMSLKKLFIEIRTPFSQDSENINSEYVFTSGRNNLGGIIHTLNTKSYFTKISKSTKGNRREELFYREVKKQFPKLKEIVPSYIDSQIIDNIIYLTSDLIDGNTINKNRLNDVLEASMVISSIKYKDIINLFPNRDYPFDLKNRPISIVRLFTKIHEEYYNEKIFSSFYNLLNENNYPSEVFKQVSRLENQIMGNYLYKFIQPNEHYSLLHGDFIQQNIKEKGDNKELQIFDWGTFAIGPHFIDIARYLTSEKLSYEEVKNVYLECENLGDNLTYIERIFFLYALILLYILTFKAKEIEENMERCVLPALEDLEILVNKFKKDNFNKIVHSLVEKKEKVENQNKKLKKKNSTLKKEKDKINTQLNGLLNSKSWKITAPLRKFNSRKKN